GPSYDRRAYQETSIAPFRLRDGSVRVLVDPDGITADFLLPQRVNTGHPKTVERFEKSGGEPLLDLGEFAAGSGSGVGTDQVVGHLYEEWAIAPDVRVYVLGAAGAGPDGVRLGRPGSGPFLLSVSDPARQAQVACADAGNRRAPAMVYAGLGAAMLVAGVLLALL
ncbi:MAG TPA: GIDE domain-containing protein, partial [Mycobacteriales bacterium]|nr:GIDE domain-containing protein [Mycobacteriales bacterium]